MRDPYMKNVNLNRKSQIDSYCIEILRPFFIDDTKVLSHRPHMEMITLITTVVSPSVYGDGNIVVSVVDECTSLFEQWFMQSVLHIPEGTVLCAYHSHTQGKIRVSRCLCK